MRNVRIGKVALVDGGTWNATTGYAPLTYVLHNGDGWWSYKANINSEPSASNPNWIQATNVQALLAAITEKMSAVETLQSTINTAEASRATAESSRVSAEEARATADQQRTTNENARIAEEAARVVAEANRVAAEANRNAAETSRNNRTDVAIANAVTATNLANSTAQAAQGALATAEQAVTTANSAATAATNAKNTAEQAVATAEEASTAATEAVASVNTAISNANSAAASANAAAAAAAGAENVNISLNGSTVTITNRNGATSSTTVVGQKGADGKDGTTPTIGSNGHWYLGTTDTGVSAEGQTGPQGPQGPQGPAGNDGADGKDGKDGASDANDVTYDSTKTDYKAGSVGKGLIDLAQKVNGAQATTMPTDSDGAWKPADNSEYAVGSISADEIVFSDDTTALKNGTIIYAEAGNDAGLTISWGTDWLAAGSYDTIAVGDKIVISIMAVYNGNNSWVNTYSVNKLTAEE